MFSVSLSHAHRMACLLTSTGLATLASLQPVIAQEAGEEDQASSDTIVITGDRRAQILTDVEPDYVLSAEDIAAYGAGSIEELLEYLEPQTRSSRGRGDGRPVFLINGRRISGFRELRSFPPEAIERMEILPEEAALAYGYRADQRVVNFILKPQFNAITLEAELESPTQGDPLSGELEGALMRITDRKRMNLDLGIEGQQSLLESDRDIDREARANPYALDGNIQSAIPGMEIDPALSALAGMPVTVASIPMSAATGAPTVQSFVPGANEPAETDISPFRTLVPEQREVSLAASYLYPLTDTVDLTLSGNLTQSETESLLGLAPAELTLPAENPSSPFSGDTIIYRYLSPDAVLVQESENLTGEVSALVNGRMAGWNWTVTGTANASESDTITDREADTTGLQARIDAGDASLNPFAALNPATPLRQDENSSSTRTYSLDGVTNGALLELPAGDVSTTVQASLNRRDLSSDSLVDGTRRQTDLGRTEITSRVSVDVPLTDETVGPAWLGELSVNGNAEVTDYSDFGTLSVLGGGLNWRPVDGLSFILSTTLEEGAPSIGDLGNPVTETPNQRTFDYVNGETVEVVRISGGNPDLIADSRTVYKAGFSWKPVEYNELQINGNYVFSRTENPISSFPPLTAEIEAAFPDRFERDADGTLRQIDVRSVNFQESQRQEVQWGLSWSKQLGQPSGPPSGAGRSQASRPNSDRPGDRADSNGRSAPSGESASPEQSAPSRDEDTPSGDAQRRNANADEQEGTDTNRRSDGDSQASGRSAGGRGGFGGGRGGPPPGRFFVSANHTWYLEDTVLIRDGLPELDLLDGSATGSLGGQPEHEIDLRAGLFKNGMGGFATYRWQSGTRVETGIVGSGETLDFSARGTMDLRLFADLGQQQKLVADHAWLKNVRVSLNIDNVFDERLEVRDETGTVPLNYQRDLLDPTGRTIEISLRKLFQ